MYNIHTHTHTKYREAAAYKENESSYYFSPLIPSLPVPTPAPNWRSGHLKFYAQIVNTATFKLLHHFCFAFVLILEYTIYAFFVPLAPMQNMSFWGWLTQITQRQHDLCMPVLTCWFLWLLVTRCLSLALYGDCLNYQQSEADCCHNIFWPKFLVVI